MHAHTDPDPRRNRLLNALPPAVYRRLSPHFEFVRLATGDLLFAPDKPIDYVYFPLLGVGSLLVTMLDGTKVEAATVGNEGIIGVGIILEALHVHLEAMCQVPGAAIRINAPAFRKALDRQDELSHLMHRYAQALMVQFTQGVACNRLHPVEQRCARWLLMTHDRVDSDTFPLTQEFLGQMLGVRRASVTVVAGLLQKAQLIRYARGIIHVLDRKGLETQSCECYHVIQREMHRLTNGSPKPEKK